MTKVLIKKLDAAVELPSYKTSGASGMDLMAFIKEPITLKPQKSCLVPTGISVAFLSLEIPKDSNIYFICKSGMRSNLAANMIENEGYKSLFNVEDGFTLGWKPKGLPSAEY